MMTVNFQKKTKVQHKTVAVLSSLALLGVSLAGCSRAPTQQDQQAASGQAATQSNAGASDKGGIKLLMSLMTSRVTFIKATIPCLSKTTKPKIAAKPSISSNRMAVLANKRSQLPMVCKRTWSV